MNNTLHRLTQNIYSNKCFFKKGTTMSLKNWLHILDLKPTTKYFDLFEPVSIDEIVDEKEYETIVFRQLSDFYTNHQNPPQLLHKSEFIKTLDAIYNIGLPSASLWVDYYLRTGEHTTFNKALKSELKFIENETK